MTTVRVVFPGNKRPYVSRSKAVKSQKKPQEINFWPFALKSGAYIAGSNVASVATFVTLHVGMKKLFKKMSSWNWAWIITYAVIVILALIWGYYLSVWIRRAI